MADSIIGPTSHYFYSQRLKLHYVDWGNADKPLMILVHGGRDHCRNWDWVALELRRHYHVIAPDLRGHGDSDWAVGGSYSMIDYVLDLAQLMKAVDHRAGHADRPFAGRRHRPAVHRRISRTASNGGLDRGTGAAARDDPGDAGLRADGELGARDARARRSASRASTRRSRRRWRGCASANPHLSDEQARHLTIHGRAPQRERHLLVEVRQLRSRHLAVHVQYLQGRDAKSGDASRCPTLLIRGDESWAGDWERTAASTRSKTRETGDDSEGRPLGASRSARRIPDSVHRFLGEYDSASAAAMNFDPRLANPMSGRS